MDKDIRYLIGQTHTRYLRVILFVALVLAAKVAGG